MVQPPNLERKALRRSGIFALLLVLFFAFSLQVQGSSQTTKAKSKHKTTSKKKRKHATKVSKPNSKAALVAEGRDLFGKNCVVCHGANGIGDEGPSMHKLGLSDSTITWKILNGKKNDMPGFAGKLNDKQVKAIIVYIRTLN